MRGRPLAAVLALLLLVALGAQTRRGWAQVRSTSLVGAVKSQMAALAPLGRVPGPLLRAAERALVDARRLAPAAIEPRAFRGDLQLLAGRDAEAVRVYDEALAHEVRPETLLNQGIALWRLGRREEALVQLRRAVALAPPLRSAVPAEAAPALGQAAAEPLPPR